MSRTRNFARNALAGMLGVSLATNVYLLNRNSPTNNQYPSDPRITSEISKDVDRLREQIEFLRDLVDYQQIQRDLADRRTQKLVKTHLEGGDIGLAVHDILAEGYTVVFPYETIARSIEDISPEEIPEGYIRDYREELHQPNKNEKPIERVIKYEPSSVLFKNKS